MSKVVQSSLASFNQANHAVRTPSPPSLVSPPLLLLLFFKPEVPVISISA